MYEPPLVPRPDANALGRLEEQQLPVLEERVAVAPNWVPTPPPMLPWSKLKPSSMSLPGAI